MTKLSLVMGNKLIGSSCSFVCAMAAASMAYPRRFRSYRVRENASANCEIWEAARATTAAPTFFKRMSIGAPGQVKEDFIDAGIRCNNPVKEVMEEARLVFGDERPVGCLVSIGTGHPGTIGLSKPDAFQKILPSKLIDVLKGIATDCESTAVDLTRRFRRRDDTYFRFNVTHGAGLISLEEWKKMGEVQGHTISYLQDPSVSKAIDSVVGILCASQAQTDPPAKEYATLADICTL